MLSVLDTKAVLDFVADAVRYRCRELVTGNDHALTAQGVADMLMCYNKGPPGTHQVADLLVVQVQAVITVLGMAIFVVTVQQKIVTGHLCVCCALDLDVEQVLVQLMRDAPHVIVDLGEALIVDLDLAWVHFTQEVPKHVKRTQAITFRREIVVTAHEV